MIGGCQVFVLIGRLKRATPEGALTKGVWHAAYVGERQLFRHHWGTGAASTSRSVTGAQPKCGANMMTGGKGGSTVIFFGGSGVRSTAC